MQTSLLVYRQRPPSTALVGNSLEFYYEFAQCLALSSRTVEPVYRTRWSNLRFNIQRIKIKRRIRGSTPVLPSVFVTVRNIFFTVGARGVHRNNKQFTAQVILYCKTVTISKCPSAVILYTPSK